METGRTKRIVTHNGPAHLDEVMTCALIYAMEDAIIPIKRVTEPTDQEMEDPDVAVIDIGNKYEPLKMNYDHHQLAQYNDDGTINHKGIECTLSMFVRDINRDLYAYLDASEFRDQTTWFRTLRYVDQLGITAAAKILGNGINLSFLQSTAPVMFEDRPEECSALLAPFWDQILGDFDEYLPKMDTFRQRHDIKIFTDLGGWVFTDANARDMGLFERSFYWEDLPDIMVMRDFKTPGFIIINRNKRNRIRFHQCSGDDRVTDIKQTSIRTLATCTESDFRELIYTAKVYKETNK